MLEREMCSLNYHGWMGGERPISEESRKLLSAPAEYTHAVSGRNLCRRVLTARMAVAHSEWPRTFLDCPSFCSYKTAAHHDG